MFPLFRKDSGKSAEAFSDKLHTGARTPSAGPAASVARESARTMEQGSAGAGGILVQESGLQLTAEAEEAVILYASGRIGEATTALNRFILDYPDSRDPLPWRMLFDLYEATGQRQPFEDLAVDFAVRFERSPPTWQALGDLRETHLTGRVPSFTFPATLMPQDRAQLQNFYLECAQSRMVELDFSKTPVPATDSQAETLLVALRRVIDLDKAVRVVGGEAFLVRLNASRVDDRLGQSGWLLLLMVLRLMGKAEAFEQAALEFAVRFEISPPSYVAPKLLPEDLPQTGLTSAPDPAEGFPLKGVLDAGAAGVFEELKRFARSRPSIEIDLSEVARIDFRVVGLLIETLMGLSQGGRKITLRGANQLVDLLLRMVGADQHATLLPRTRN